LNELIYEEIPLLVLPENKKMLFRRI